MSLASTHHELSERLENGRRIWTHVQHMKPIASYKSGSLRRDPGVLSATGSADWPLAVDGICDVRVDPRIAGKSPLLHFGHGKDFVRFALVGANNVSGVSKGNVTTFTNAWNGADLRYTYGRHRLQEDILLRSKHPRSFGFILREHTGFDPVTMTVGDIRILDPVLEPPSGSDKLAVPLRWIVTQQGGYWVLTVTLPEGDWAGWVVDPTLSLQPNAADGKDNSIAQSAPTGNQGNAIYCDITGAVGGQFSPLIEFNLAALPAGAIVTSATMNVYHYYNAFTPTVSVYRVLRSWTELGSTWNKADAGTDWGTAGCNNTTTDRNAAATGTWTGLRYNWRPSDVTADVAAFAAGTATNYGWLHKIAEGTANYIAFYSSDYAVNASLRPQLVVDYTLPAAGLPLLEYAHSGGLM